MRVLFSLLSAGFLKNFESTIEELARRGHDVELLVHERTGLKGVDELGARLTERWPNVRMTKPPVVRDPWPDVSIGLRSCHDLLYFADERFSRAYFQRASARAPWAFRRLARQRLVRSRPGRALLRRLLLALEELAPVSPTIEDRLRERRPDVALFSPLIGLRTDQPHWARAARGLGIPTVACVASWDHLTSKTVLRPLPNLVTLWNPTQAREAEHLHRVPPELIEITGAQLFDLWFEWPARPRDAFCVAAGLDPARPIVLYTCFSPFKSAPPEREFVTRWLTALREHSDERLRTANVLIRPHPKRLEQWRDVDLSGSGPVAVWPRDGRFMSDDESKADFFDSLYHADAVAGLNTSAMIEAAIVGRPVYTPLVPEYETSQEGTLHFRYLREVGGGLLHVASDVEGHLDQIAEALQGRADPEAGAAFVRDFVRPLGRDVPATPRLVDAIERVAAAPSPARARTRRLDPPLRAALGPAAGLLSLRLRAPARAGGPRVGLGERPAEEPRDTTVGT